MNHWYFYSKRFIATRIPGECERCCGRTRKKDSLCWQCRQWEKSDEGQQWLKDEEERLERLPMYSVCKANRKFFWLATPTRDYWWRYANEQMPESWLESWRSGYADSREAALSAASLAYPGGLEDRPGHAIHYHRGLAGRRRVNRMKANPSQVREGVTVDFLWLRPFWSDHWEKARIIRKTAKRIFVITESQETHFDPKEYEEHPEWFHTCAVDREKLERQGWAYAGGRRYHDTVYTEEGKRNYEAEIARWRSGAELMPDFLVALGLTQGCTEKDVKRAYRRKSREAHPDGGGSHESFIKLTDHFDMALRYVRCNQIREHAA